MAHLRAAVIYVIDPSEQCGKLLSKSINSSGPNICACVILMLLFKIICGKLVFAESCCSKYCYFHDSNKIGHTIEAQKSLFDNIRPLFTNKPLMVVANKTDVWKDNLSPEKQQILGEFHRDLEGEKIFEMSTKDDEESVVQVKIEACEVLLQHRVEQKFKTRKVSRYWLVAS